MGSIISRGLDCARSIYIFCCRTLSYALSIFLGCLAATCLFLYFFPPLMGPVDAAAHIPGWDAHKSQLVTISSFSGIVTATPVWDNKDSIWKLIPNGLVIGKFKVESFANPASAHESSIPKASGNQAWTLEGQHTSSRPGSAVFDAAAFEKLLSVPAKRLHPGLGNQGPVLVIFTWSECPTCAALLNYFEEHKEQYPFQVLFVPIAGTGDKSPLDESALGYLGKLKAPRNEQKELLKGVRVASKILAEQTGSLRVPAFAWRVGGETGCGNLSGRELDRLLTRMAKVSNQGSSE